MHITPKHAYTVPLLSCILCILTNPTQQHQPIAFVFPHINLNVITDLHSTQKRSSVDSRSQMNTLSPSGLTQSVLANEGAFIPHSLLSNPFLSHAQELQSSEETPLNLNVPLHAAWKQ